MIIWLDTETRGELSVTDVGAYRYTEQPSFRPLLIQYAFDDGPVSVWDYRENNPYPADLLRALLDENNTVIAQNYQFDKLVLARSGIEVEAQWRDLMAKALIHGFPGNLAEMGRVFKLEGTESKIKDGKRLIKLFCTREPAEWTFELELDWCRFREYAVRDVETMRLLWSMLPSYNYPNNPGELEVWKLDRKINDYGFRLDQKLIDGMLHVIAGETERLNTELRTITGGAVERGTQHARLKSWAEEILGEYFSNFDKNVVDGLLKRENLPPDVRKALEIRRELGKASTAKYDAGRAGTCADGRYRGSLQYSGAERTGRWAGRGIQPQNMPARGIPEKEETDEFIQAVREYPEHAHTVWDRLFWRASAAARGMIIAPLGRTIAVADLAGIEGRITAWHANQSDKIEAFFRQDKGDGFDSYVLAYAKSFGVPPESVTKDQRQIGKVLELSMGYEGGVSALAKAAADYRIDLESYYGHVWDSGTPEQRERAMRAWARDRNKTELTEKFYVTADILKQMWRAANPKIRQLWYDLKDAITNAINFPGRVFAVNRIRIKVESGMLLIRIASGRILVFYNPALDGEGNIAYEGLVKTDGRRYWGTLGLYGGKVLENIVQAEARDIMAQGMLRADNAGYDIILTVHDEILGEIADNKTEITPKLSDLMVVVPDYAKGLPLSAKGFTTKRYYKD
jgi:DNA polymerase